MCLQKDRSKARQLAAAPALAPTQAGTARGVGGWGWGVGGGVGGAACAAAAARAACFSLPACLAQALGQSSGHSPRAWRTSQEKWNQASHVVQEIQSAAASWPRPQMPQLSPERSPGCAWQRLACRRGNTASEEPTSATDRVPGSKLAYKRWSTAGEEPPGAAKGGQVLQRRCPGSQSV